MEIFITCLALFIGHILGDFILQTKEMAIKKSEPTREGWKLCAMHVWAYTLIVFTAIVLTLPESNSASEKLTWSTMLGLALFIGVPHFIIDKFSLANYLNPRAFKTIGDMVLPTDSVDMAQVKVKVDLVFTCLLYFVLDQALHVVCLSGIVVYFYG